MKTLRESHSDNKAKKSPRPRHVVFPGLASLAGLVSTINIHESVEIGTPSYQK